MIEQEEALARIVASLRAGASRSLPLIDAVGCFAAGDYFATVSLPPFDNSAIAKKRAAGPSLDRTYDWGSRPPVENPDRERD